MTKYYAAALEAHDDALHAYQIAVTAFRGHAVCELVYRAARKEYVAATAIFRRQAAPKRPSSEPPTAMNYDPTDPDKMKLQPGVTCGDCYHIARCKAMFGHVETDTYCDWSPSRFHPSKPSPSSEQP